MYTTLDLRHTSTTANTVNPLHPDVASTTKWVSGTMIMRVVASGKLKLSDYVHQVRN